MTREERAAYMRMWREKNRERLAAYEKRRSLTEERILRGRGANKRWREKNKEKRAAYIKLWADRNPRSRADTFKRYHEKNRERRLFQNKIYYNENRERLLGANRVWIKNNPDKARALWAKHKFKRRSLIKEALCDFTAEQWREIQDRQHYKCAACGAQEPLTIDHIVAVTKGGPHTASNIQGLCMSCNQRKNNKEADYRKDEHKWTAAEILGL